MYLWVCLFLVILRLSVVVLCQYVVVSSRDVLQPKWTPESLDPCQVGPFSHSSMVFWSNELILTSIILALLIQLDWHLTDGRVHLNQSKWLPVTGRLTGRIAFCKHLLCLALRWATYFFFFAACCRPHTGLIWVNVRERERGRAWSKKSLHIILWASLDLTFGIHACLNAPFNASAVIKSLIKLMLNLPREHGVGEKYDCRRHQPSASNMLMLQAISPNRPSFQAEPEPAAH